VTEVVTAARQRVDRIKTLVGAARADIIESFRQRDWIALGYESWDALCSAEFGTVLRLSVEDRQQAVSELRGAGMSTRAIGSALGVSDVTVRRDIEGATNVAPDPVVKVSGLDGKTYDYARVEDDAPRTGAIEAMLDADPDVRAARLRHRFTKELLLPLHGLHLFDPIEMARVAPDRLGDLDSRIAALTAFRSAYAKALKPNLHILKES
jgi:hypothetical protein